ncbi:MAG TPA: hypothetical protein VFC31_06595 [Candidatus Limnocylindria bacterium]|nr:hypothetical protein [Candidatus Limnocylindria bacterium]
MRGSDASRAFAQIIAPDPSGDPEPGRLVGLEHEFIVLDPNAVVDFRTMVGDIPLGGRRLDPADKNATRCAWGGIVTADGAEAEIATPPIRRAPGFVSRLERTAIGAREALHRALPKGFDLSGYSTHLSFSMPAQLNEAAARLFLSTFAPGMMLLGDRADSPGLLVRPRPGRLELAFEYLDGPQLRGATAFATGAAMVAGDAVTRRDPTRLPPLVRAFGVTTADRYGWGLTRDAFGDDIVVSGRGAVLERRRGGTITAQEQLEASWESARSMLAGNVDPRDLREADALVAGRLALPSERVWSVTTSSATDATAAWPQRNPFGDVIRTRERPGYTVTAEVATWDTTVFALSGPWRRAYASVPRESLATFLRKLDSGRLDAVLIAFLDSVPEGTRLASFTDAVRPGLFDALGPVTSLVASEVMPMVVDGGWIDTDRPGKLDEHWMFPVPYHWMAVAILVFLVALYALTRNDYTNYTPPPLPTTTSGTTAAAPRVVHFTATFAGTTTTYQVDITDPAGGGLTYSWSRTNQCGSFVASGPVASWNHPDIPGGCPAEAIHLGNITVTAVDKLGRTASYTYTGGSAPADIRP